jgi:hypothetical protein
VASVWVSWDLSWPSGFLDETYKTSSIAGWLTSTGQDGKVLAISRGQARELISGPSMGANTKVMSFNRTQSRAVIGLLTGQNTLRWHLYLLGPQDGLLCRKCGVSQKCSTALQMTHLQLCQLSQPQQAVIHTTQFFLCRHWCMVLCCIALSSM